MPSGHCHELRRTRELELLICGEHADRRCTEHLHFEVMPKVKKFVQTRSISKTATVRCHDSEFRSERFLDNKFWSEHFGQNPQRFYSECALQRQKRPIRATPNTSRATFAADRSDRHRCKLIKSIFDSKNMSK